MIIVNLSRSDRHSWVRRPLGARGGHERSRCRQTLAARAQSTPIPASASRDTASMTRGAERIASACRVQVPIDGLGGPVDSLAPIDGDRAVEKERFSYRQTSVRHVRLKCRGKDSARSFCHNCSCAAASSPLSGRSSTYRPVRIWPTTSVSLHAFIILTRDQVRCPMRPLRREGVDLAEASTSLDEPRRAGTVIQGAPVALNNQRLCG
jgi:hypothetical protein